MATVARLLPRHWDGRRLLQFLTGLALIALAFALPALLSPVEQPAEAPVTVITTVDTPLKPGLPATDLPSPTEAAGKQAGLALGPATDQAAAADHAAGTDEAAGTDHAAQTGSSGQSAGAVHSSAAQGLTWLLPVQERHSGRVCAAARAAVGGFAQRAHGERGPPRA